MTCRLIVDIGSCHDGKPETAFGLIDAAADAGAWGVKGQLFPDREEFTRTGNVPLPEDWIHRLVDRGRKRRCKVFFSSFGEPHEQERYLRLMWSEGMRIAKFAFPHRYRHGLINQSLGSFEEVIVSMSPMDLWLFPDHPRLTKLYCHSIHGEPVYPVESVLDFAAILPLGFDGVSLHTLGTDQMIRAINAGAKVLEVHMKLPDTPLRIPDARFALEPAQVAEIVRHVAARAEYMATSEDSAHGVWGKNYPGLGF